MKTSHKVVAVLFFLAVCAAAVPAADRLLRLRRAENTPPSDLYQVVYSQLNAFRAQDYSLAYSQASRGVRQKFNQEQFEKMMRADYGDITQAERVEFGIVKCRDRRALIQVLFIGRDGSVLPCIYNLIFEGQRWKIDGDLMLPRRPSDSQFEGLRV